MSDINITNNNDFILYKYMSWEIACLVLESKTLKVTDPTTFNDPFDCQIPHIDSNIESFKRFVRNKMPHNPDKEDTQSYENNITKLVKISNYEESSKKWIEIWKEKIRGFRVLSLSRTNNNILMWSHYSYSHQGIVLGFKKKTNFLRERFISEGELALVKDVEYIDTTKPEFKEEFNRYHMELMFETAEHEPSELDRISRDLPNGIYKKNSPSKLFLPYLFKKRDNWKYEKEFRCVWGKSDTKLQHRNDGSSYISFELTDIAEIIFGVKTKPEHIQQFKQFYLKNKEQFDLNFTIKKATEYDLELKIQPFDIETFEIK